MITPKPFVMNEPHAYLPGRWEFVLYISEEYIGFVQSLACVSRVEDFQAAYKDEFHVHINSRYDHQEAWQWIYEQIESEMNEIKLSSLWDVEL